MKNYCDAQGYPGTIQADGSYDGGDTAAIIGTVEALTPIAASITVPALCFTKDSCAQISPVRHPNVSMWYGRPDRFSRDQLVATLCGRLAVGYSASNSVTTVLYVAHRHRYFLTAWNTKGNGQMDMPDKFPDICGPEVWALWIRILGPWWGFLVLWLLDVQTLIGSLQWRYLEPKTNRITRNHMLVCLATIEHRPTFVSKLACRINNWTDLVDRWDAHCSAVGEYPTAELFREKIRSVMK